MSINKFFNLCSLLAIVIFIAALQGCSDSITNSTTSTTDKYKARTESEFNADASLKTIPGAVVYVDLEHLNSPASGVNGDTGPIGEDVITYVYTESATHRFKLDAGAKFTARLVNAEGAVMFTLNNPGDTARVTLPAGSYKLYLTSLLSYAFSPISTQAVFIQPDVNAIASGGVGAQGGYNPQDLNTLLTTNKCIGCNLNEVQLHDKNLTGADLSYAGLSHSFMQNVNLSNATFAHTDWTDAGANNCIFREAKFIFTIVNRTPFYRGDFSHAVFQRLNWDHTSFLESNMTYATFDSGAADNGSLDGSDLSYATLTNLSMREMSGEGVKAINTTFSNVYSYEMVFINAVMDSAKFINGSIFQSNTMRGSKIRYAEMTNFRADGSIFDDCNLTGSRITNVGFNGGSLRAAILLNSVWNNVEIYAVNMCHQDRTGAVFSNMHYNVDTDCWP